MSDWITFPCPGSAPAWRYLPDGHVEVDGEGVPTRKWPPGVNVWSAQIMESAFRYGLPPQIVASIMAIESGGKTGLCARLADGTCSPREGAGLMQVLPSTASTMAGRTVTSEELLSDHALNIDLGAKYLRDAVAQNGGDFVMGAVAYNAGKVRCGVGNVWRADASAPKVQCPPTSWGVVMGCTETPNGIVVNDYPRRAIEYLNAAIDNFTGAGGAVPVEPTSMAGLPTVAAFAVVGFLLAHYAPGVIHGRA